VRELGRGSIRGVAARPDKDRLCSRDGFAVAALDIFVTALLYVQDPFDRKGRCRTGKYGKMRQFSRREASSSFWSARFLIQYHTQAAVEGRPIPSMSGYCVSALESQSWKVAARVTGEGSPFPATGLIDGPNLYL
jgi:hypothetical protein